MNKELNVILKEMKVNKSNGDTEHSHGRADDLLIETIRTLSKKATREEKDKVNKIIKTYNSTEKWYA